MIAHLSVNMNEISLKINITPLGGLPRRGYAIVLLLRYVNPENIFRTFLKESIKILQRFFFALKVSNAHFLSVRVGCS